jgi:hypothetical protein
MNESLPKFNSLNSEDNFFPEALHTQQCHGFSPDSLVID